MYNSVQDKITHIFVNCSCVNLCGLILDNLLMHFLRHVFVKLYEMSHRKKEKDSRLLIIPLHYHIKGKHMFYSKRSLLNFDYFSIGQIVFLTYLSIFISAIFIS